MRSFYHTPHIVGPPQEFSFVSGNTVDKSDDQRHRQQDEQRWYTQTPPLAICYTPLGIYMEGGALIATSTTVVFVVFLVFAGALIEHRFVVSAIVVLRHSHKTSASASAAVAAVVVHDN